MGWLLRLVTGAPLVVGAPTVRFYFKSEGRGPDLKKCRGPGWLRYASAGSERGRTYRTSGVVPESGSAGGARPAAAAWSGAPCLSTSELSDDVLLVGEAASSRAGLPVPFTAATSPPPPPARRRDDAGLLAARWWWWLPRCGA